MSKATNPGAIAPAPAVQAITADSLGLEFQAQIDCSKDGGLAVLTQIRDLVRDLPVATGEAQCVDRISLLEDIKSAAASAQMREAVELRSLRLDREAAAGVPASKRGKGLGAEIALARRESLQSGSRFLGVAHVMHADMLYATTALREGLLNEFTASLLAQQVLPLPSATCRAVDEALSPQYGNLGTRRLVDTARAISNQVDPASQIARYEKARSERRVSVHPAADGMSFLTALLPTTQAFACKKALRDAAAIARATGDIPFAYGTPADIAAASPDSRSGAQIEVDLLVERLTGQSSPDAIPVELHVVMTDRAVFGTHYSSRGSFNPNGSNNVPGGGSEHAGASEPDGGIDPIHASAWIPGLGPMPAAIARDLLDPRHDPPSRGGSTSEAERVYLRRVLLDPITGDIAKMDTRKRAFAGTLRRALIIRDDYCRTPYCGAPIVHLDHTHPFAGGGRTNAANGTGLCARCNYTKELPGWKHDREPGSAALTVTTPTGQRRTSTPPPIIPRL